MTDRELLEAAAKAAGYTLGNHTQAEWKRTLGGVEWNPLEDDGDALRLAVKLRFMVDTYDPQDDEDHTPCSTAWWTMESLRAEEHNGDPYAATRRAIVRAAAVLATSQAQG